MPAASWKMIPCYISSNRLAWLDKIEPTNPMMNLNQYGGACRCLLRLLENEGQPGFPDEAFLTRFLPRYPAWQERPGATDALAVFELAKELQLADGIDIFRDYDRVLREHRAGHAILVTTERAPVQDDTATDVRHHVMLLVEMNAESFVVWCPFESGSSDLLPRADRIWWEKWFAVGIVLSKGGSAEINPR
jgi:hypothetical protein